MRYARERPPRRELVHRLMLSNFELAGTLDSGGWFDLLVNATPSDAGVDQ